MPKCTFKLHKAHTEPNFKLHNVHTPQNKEPEKVWRVSAFNTQKKRLYECIHLNHTKYDNSIPNGK